MVVRRRCGSTLACAHKISSLRLFVTQVEKVDHTTAVQLLRGLGEIESVGVSLGSFSLSALLLAALMREFEIELDSKASY